MWKRGGKWKTFVIFSVISRSNFLKQTIVMSFNLKLECKSGNILNLELVQIEFGNIVRWIVNIHLNNLISTIYFSIGILTFVTPFHLNHNWLLSFGTFIEW